VSRSLAAVIVGLFAVGVVIDSAIGAQPFPGYAASIGLFGCVLIIVVSKGLGNVLSRPEDDPVDTSDLRGDLHG